MFDNDELFSTPRHKPKSLGEAISALLSSNPALAEGIVLAAAKEVWLTSNTPSIVNATGEIYLRNDTLCIQILNPSLRANLNAMRNEVGRQLNERISLVQIREVKFV